MKKLAFACVAMFGLAVVSTSAHACGYKTKTVSTDTPVKTVQLPQTKAPSTGG